MKKMFLISFCCFLTFFSFSQTAENEKLIELGKAYKDFMFRNEPPVGFTKSLLKDVPENLKPSADFIAQTITTNTDLLKPQYTARPDNTTLKTIFIITAVNDNMRSESPTDNNKLIDSLKKADISIYEMLHNYYSILFTAVGNKRKTFDLSKVNFKFKEMSFKDDTEKGIFFLECMKSCGTEIWGYINIVKPANTSKALSYINKFPKFDGVKYYQFTDLNFPDFKLVMEEGNDSYKNFFINKYYDLLLSHLICLKKEGASQKEVNDLLLGSILRDTKFYKYTKNKEVLESIFQLQKQ